jgi:hypothetical protein
VGNRASLPSKVYFSPFPPILQRNSFEVLRIRFETTPLRQELRAAAFLIIVDKLSLIGVAEKMRRARI